MVTHTCSILPTCLNHACTHTHPGTRAHGHTHTHITFPPPTSAPPLPPHTPSNPPTYTPIPPPPQTHLRSICNSSTLNRRAETPPNTRARIAAATFERAAAEGEGGCALAVGEGGAAAWLCNTTEVSHIVSASSRSRGFSGVKPESRATDVCVCVCVCVYCVRLRR